MKNLVGRSFQIADGHYRIVDVQRLGGDAMVYAERLEAVAAGGEDDTRHPPARTAFHYGDIAPFLEEGQRA